MNTSLKVGVVVAVSLLAACVGDAGDDAELSEPVPAEPVAAGAGGVPMEQPQSMLGLDSLENAGAYITGPDGRAVYLLEGEPAGQSSCYDACADEWPPLLAGAGATDGGAAGVQPNLIGTLERRDGSAQVTYGGHALYYYHDDTGPGEIKGQDVTDQWGEWYLVRPSGEPLEEHSGEESGA